MNRKGRRGKTRWLWLLVFFLLILLSSLLLLWPQTMKYTYETAEKPTFNPLKGWVRWGENTDNTQDTALAYVAVHWSELESEKGTYDFSVLEQRWNFQYWKEQGVHLILRVIADEPSSQSHMDIPEWLYEEMGGSGTWYHSSYGKGFSPDYTHPAMIEAHERLLKALGERYDEDAQIAYVQLGSLGHWGEWHVNQSAGIETFPSMDISNQYIKHYVDAFTSTPLLMRRPYPAVNEDGLGLYNDSLGLESNDTRLLDWIENGYVSDQTEETLPACPDFWKFAPSGGELGSGIEMEQYFTEKADALLSAIKKLHTSWVGPKSPQRAELSENAQKNMDTISAEMGYCYSISKMTSQKSILGGIKISLNFKNLGVAPMYASWPVRLELRDANGELVSRCEVSANQTSWIETGKVNCKFPKQSSKKEALTLWVGIVDPMTGTCRVALANDLPNADGMYCLGDI